MKNFVHLAMVIGAALSAFGLTLAVGLAGMSGADRADREPAQVAMSFAPRPNRDRGVLLARARRFDNGGNIDSRGDGRNQPALAETERWGARGSAKAVGHEVRSRKP